MTDILGSPLYLSEGSPLLQGVDMWDVNDTSESLTSGMESPECNAWLGAHNLSLTDGQKKQVIALCEDEDIESLVLGNPNVICLTELGIPLLETDGETRRPNPELIRWMEATVLPILMLADPEAIKCITDGRVGAVTTERLILSTFVTPKLATLKLSGRQSVLPMFRIKDCPEGLTLTEFRALLQSSIKQFYSAHSLDFEFGNEPTQ